MVGERELLLKRLPYFFDNKGHRTQLTGIARDFAEFHRFLIIHTGDDQNNFVDMGLKVPTKGKVGY